MKHGARPLRPGLGIRANLLSWLDRPRELAFDAADVAAARAWQRKARRAFERCLGDPPPPVEPRVDVIAQKQCDGYRRTLLTLDTAVSLQALCWLCVPDGVSPGEPRPAMIATPGHGLGAKDLIALDARGRPRKEGDGYQKDYALQAVRLGYPTLVIEPLGFGDRRDADHMRGKTGESGCHAGFTLATMLGTTLARLRINDIQRGLDYLQTVPGVDPDRIGLMGISGGGQMTLWTAAVEPRIRATIVSGYLNSFETSVMAMNHCICNFIPGVARLLDHADLAALVAPRPMLIQSGTRDPIFPITATRAATECVIEIYSVFDAADRIAVDIFRGDHQWSPRKVAPFLAQWL